MKTTVHDHDYYCPYCKHTFNAASDIKEENSPQDGDFTICINCSGISKFVMKDNEPVTVREVSSEELREFKESDEEGYNYLIQVKAMILEIIDDKKQKSDV